MVLQYPREYHQATEVFHYGAALYTIFKICLLSRTFFYSLGPFVQSSYDRVRIGLPSCQYHNFFRLAYRLKIENAQPQFEAEQG